MTALLNHIPNTTYNVDKFIATVEEYAIKYIMDAVRGPLFISGELAEAKKLSKGDYVDNWMNTIAPGIHYKLVGDELKHFKLAYKSKYDISLGRINSLIVLDWERALVYLEANTCNYTPRKHFREVDIEKAFVDTFGGIRQQVVAAGRMDIISEDYEEVVEVKKAVVDCNTVGQLIRYLDCNGIKKGKLVAPSITDDAINLIRVVNLAGYNLTYTEYN